MKLLIQLFILTFFISCQLKQENINVKEDGMEPELLYDSLKAMEYGADKYGMKKYVFAFLKRGPNKPTDSLVAAELQSAHMHNISKLAEEGKLVLAGPFFGNDSLRGVYIFNTSSLEEAEEWTSTDPAIKYGSLVMELKEWYGSAALMSVNNEHNTLSKSPI